MILNYFKLHSSICWGFFWMHQAFFTQPSPSKVNTLCTHNKIIVLVAYCVIKDTNTPIFYGSNLPLHCTLSFRPIPGQYCLILLTYI